MILTGSKIQEQVGLRTITIEPFSPAQLNPNSYNYRLGDEIGCFDPEAPETYDLQRIPDGGFVLEPMRLYLGCTHEVLGSSRYAMSLIGRSSIGRLGLFLQISANLGHTGSSHRWTLELVAARPIRLYRRMIIGQISFWTNLGDPELYREGYSRFSFPKPSDLAEVVS